MIKLVTLVFLSLVLKTFGQSPTLVSFNNNFIGDLNDNPFDVNSISNPYGYYGSEYSSISANNPYGKYGSEYSIYSPNNEYSRFGSPRIYAKNGAYLGKLSKNQFDLESTGNNSGIYGNPYNPFSINNSSGLFGSDYSVFSSTYLYGKSFFGNEQQSKKNNDKNMYIYDADVESPFLYLNSKEILMQRYYFKKNNRVAL